MFKKKDLYLDISITEHLIETYSRMDAERLPALQQKLKDLEWKLLDILVSENDEWLEMFKEQQAIA